MSTCCAPPSGPREPEKGLGWSRVMGWQREASDGKLRAWVLSSAWHLHLEGVLPAKWVEFQLYACVLEHQMEKIFPFLSLTNPAPTTLLPFRAFKVKQAFSTDSGQPSPTLHPPPRVQGELGPNGACYSFIGCRMSNCFIVSVGNVYPKKKLQRGIKY